LSAFTKRMPWFVCSWPRRCGWNCVAPLGADGHGERGGRRPGGGKVRRETRWAAEGEQDGRRAAAVC